MTYNPQLIVGVSLSDIRNELEWLEEQEYAYGRLIPCTRLWDLLYTRNILEHEGKQYGK